MNKVLVVDDYPEMRAFLLDVFMLEEWQVTTASGGREALSFLKQEKGWLILLDLAMPEMDGFEVLRAMRATPAVAKGNSVVVMTAKPLSHDQQEALMTLGAKAILRKPFDVDHVLQVAHTWAPTLLGAR